MKRSDLIEDIYNYIDGYTHSLIREKYLRGLAEFLVKEIEKLPNVGPWEPEDD